MNIIFLFILPTRLMKYVVDVKYILLFVMCRINFCEFINLSDGHVFTHYDILFAFSVI